MKQVMIGWILVLALFGSFGCNAEEEVCVKGNHTEASTDVVPLLRIIALPKEFSGQTVTVSGILDSDGRGAYLYLTQDAFDYFDTDLGVRVIFSMDKRDAAKSLHGKYVMLTGTIEYQDWAYPKQIVLEDIRRVEELPARE